jgi:hypothetical protein
LVARAGSRGAAESVIVDPADTVDLRVRIYAVWGGDTSYVFRFIPLAGPTCGDDAAEPNDGPAQATKVPLETHIQDLRVCDGDVDFLEIEPPPGGGPFGLRVTPGQWPLLAGEWQSWLTDGSARTWLLESDESGVQTADFVWGAEGAKLTVSTSTSQTMSWAFEALSPSGGCTDLTLGNRSPQTASVLRVASGPGSSSSVGGVLCPTPSGSLESDWYRLDVPDMDLTVTVTVTDTTGIRYVPSPAASGTLLVGSAPQVWRTTQSLDTSAGAASSGLLAGISRADRPIYIRIDGPGELPPLVESWPTHTLGVAILKAATCLQGINEGSGNEDLAHATLIGEGLHRDTLCGTEHDTYLIDLASLTRPNDPRVTLTARDGPINYEIWVDGSPPEVLRTGLAVVQNGAVEVLSGVDVPLASNLIYVRVQSVVAGDSGFLYEISVVSGPGG